jgi:hypothetical protein
MKEGTAFVNEQFRHLVRPMQMQIVSFYETVATIVTPVGILVEKDSAIMRVPDEIIIASHSTHGNLCKFPG